MAQSAPENEAGDTGASDSVTESTAGDGAPQAETGGRSRLRAKLLPWPRDTGDDDTVEIVVYVVTGWHGILPIPTSLCRECHIFTRRADMAAEQVDVDVNVTVRSMWTHLPWAHRRGWDHSPVMTVDGTLLCQGHEVPTTDEVVAAIERSAAEKGISSSS